METHLWFRGWLGAALEWLGARRGQWEFRARPVPAPGRCLCPRSLGTGYRVTPGGQGDGEVAGTPVADNVDVDEEKDSDCLSATFSRAAFSHSTAISQWLWIMDFIRGTRLSPPSPPLPPTHACCPPRHPPPPLSPASLTPPRILRLTCTPRTLPTQAPVIYLPAHR